MDELQDLRATWENPKYFSQILTIPRTDPEPELYVILKDGVKNKYTLIHYYKIGDNWAHSVDVNATEDIFECLDNLDCEFSGLICEMNLV